MAQWLLSYPSNLDAAASYDDGKDIYNKYGVIVMTHDTSLMCHAVGQVQSVGGTGGNELVGKNITNYPNIANTTFTGAPSVFEVDEFNNGFIRMLSGVAANKVYKIQDTTTTRLDSYTDLVSVGVLPDDYFEVVSGGCTYTFPLGRNPNRRDYKRTFSGESVRFPYYHGGLVAPLGWEQDDMVIMSYMADERDIDRLELFLNHLLDYKGFDSLYSTGVSGVNDEGLAPMILETGSHDIRNQYLVFITDYKIIKDAKRSDSIWEVMIHFQNFSKPMYRGI